MARISPSGYYCASADVTGKGRCFKVGYLAQLLTFDLIVVNIWDVVGEEQIVKGEYKVISGRVYVLSACSSLGWACSDCLISFLLLLVTTLHGTAKVNESSQSEMAETSQFNHFQAIFSAIRQSKKNTYLFSLRLDSAMLFLWIRVLRLAR